MVEQSLIIAAFSVMALLAAFVSGIAVGYFVGFKYPGPRMLAFVDMIRDSVSEKVREELCNNIEHNDKISNSVKKHFVEELRSHGPSKVAKSTELSKS